MDYLSYTEQRPPGKHISILPIPLSLGSDYDDTEGAPEYLLGLGLDSALSSLGFGTDLLSTISVPTKNSSNKSDYFQDISLTTINIRETVKRTIDSKRVLLALGGDHSISMGTIGGASEALGGNIGVIWIDAHSDLQTKETSLSGNIHGMSSAVLMGFGAKEMTDLVVTKVNPKNVLYLGLKDLDQFEIDMIREHAIPSVTMLEIMKDGFSSITDKIDALNKRVDNVWISLDVDAIDKQYAPASAMASSGGLTYREITNLLRYIGKVANVVGMDVVELTPKSDENNKTGELCIELIASGFGSKYDWYSSYMNTYKKTGK